MERSYIPKGIHSYGTLAGYEPDLTPSEKARLRELIKIIRQKPKEAITQLETQIKSDDRAVLP